MALPTVELIVAPATAAFRANPADKAITDPTISILRNTDGVINTYHGLQHEDSSLAYCAVAWETLAHHHNLIKDTGVYADLSKAICSILDVSGIRMYHTAFTSEPYKALDAPVTEFATFTLHEGQSKDALEGLVDDLTKAVNAAPEATGAVHAAWGPTVEKDEMVSLFIGWASVEAHWKLVETDQHIANLIAQIRQIATIDVAHGALLQ